MSVKCCEYGFELGQHICDVYGHMSTAEVGLNLARKHLTRLEAENLEQARLLGISGSKEAKLIAERDSLQSSLDTMRDQLGSLIVEYDDLRTAYDAGSWNANP